MGYVAWADCPVSWLDLAMLICKLVTLWGMITPYYPGTNVTHHVGYGGSFLDQSSGETESSKLVDCTVLCL